MKEPHRATVVAQADKVSELSADAHHALIAAIYCDIVTGVYSVGGDPKDWYIDGAVAGKDFWLTPAEWQRDYAKLLKASARS